MPCHVARGFDHFADAESAAVAEIVGELVLLAQRIEREHVRARQIADVDVIADARSVGRFVIGSENRDEFAFALRDLQNQRNQMRFGMVGFALVCGRAGGVEIAQAGVTQSVDLVKPLEHLLDEEFGFAVSIRRMNGIVFFDRRAIGSSEERGGRTENEARNSVSEDCFEKRERVRGVVAKILLGKFHRLAGFDGSGHVHDAVEFIFLEGAIKRGTVGCVAFDEFGTFRNGGFVAVAEIVVDNDVVAALQKFGGDDTADVSGASGDEYAIGHGVENPSEAEWLRKSSSQIGTERFDETRNGSAEDYIRNRAVMPVGPHPPRVLRKDVILRRLHEEDMQGCDSRGVAGGGSLRRAPEELLSGSI